MDLQNLSSNWKKLQTSLASDRIKQKNDKEIRNGHLEPAQKSRPKRVRNDELPDRKKRKLNHKARSMGSFISSLYSRAAPQNDTAVSESAKSTDPTNLSTKHGPTATDGIANQPADSITKLGKYVALDCEMVGTTSITPFSVSAHHQPPPGEKKEYSILARATLVNYAQVVVYDAYVLPPQEVRVTNYRTEYSGITHAHLDPQNATTKPKPFETVQQEVASLIESRILIGHALKNDLAVLGLTHPLRDIRDTSRYEKFRMISAVPGRRGRQGKGRTPALRILASDFLGWEIQNNGHIGHDSAEDAKAAMALFTKERKGFEEDVVRKYGPSPNRKIRGEKSGDSTGVTSAVPVNNGIISEDLDSDNDENDPNKVDDSDDGDEENRNSTHNSQHKKKRKKKKKKSRAKK